MSDLKQRTEAPRVSEHLLLLLDFIAWGETIRASEPYHYYDPSTCVWARYMMARGRPLVHDPESIFHGASWIASGDNDGQWTVGALSKEPGKF